MVGTVNPIGKQASTAMDKVLNFLQLTGMVKKKNSFINISLVVFWNFLTIGCMLGASYLYLISPGSLTNKGFTAVMLTEYLCLGLYPVLGFWTLGPLLDSFSDLNLKSVKRVTVNFAFVLLLTGMTGTATIIMIQMFTTNEENCVYDYIFITTLYLGTILTHLKTVLVAGSALGAYKVQCFDLGKCDPSMIQYQDILNSFRLLKTRISPVFLSTFGTLTVSLILTSYDAYVVFACLPEYISEWKYSIMANLSAVVSSFALLLYLSQLAEDTFDAFTSVLEPLRLKKNLAFPSLFCKRTGIWCSGPVGNN